MSLIELFDVSQIPHWVYLLFIAASLLYSYLTWNFDYWKKRGISGNKPHLFIGTFKPTWIYKVEDEDVKDVKKYGRTFGGFEGTQPVLYTTDPNIIRQVMVKDFAVFTNRRKVPSFQKTKYAKDMVFTVRDKEWKDLRTVLTPTFTTGKLKNMIGLIEECIKEFVQSLTSKIQKKPSLEMTNEFSDLTLNVIASCAFGMKIQNVESRNEFIINAKKTSRQSSKFLYFAIIFPKLINFMPKSLLPNPFGYFGKIANQTIDMRLQSNTTGNRDFLQILLEAEKSSNKKLLSRESVVAQAILFLVGGNDTISNSLSFLAYDLAMNQNVQDKLLAEVDETMNECQGKLTYEIVSKMQYLDMVISESLRFHSSVVRLERLCEKDDYSLDGISLNRGVIVVFLVYALHHDPEFYPDPEVFDPERFNAENKAKRNPFTYLPFGAGPRNCIAMRFALMELKIILVYILHKFCFRNSEETDYPLKYISSFQARFPTSVNLQLQKRFD